MVERVRRIRPIASVKRDRKFKAVQEDEIRMDELLKSIAEKNVEAARVSLERQAMEKELFDLMQMYKVAELEVPEAKAKITTPVGRAVNTVDPRGFFELVTEEDFFNSVTIGITAARKVLSEKELKPITDTVAGKKGDPVLNIEFR